ncbi:CesT family type III secretion system chaperone [Erwinia pyrifoliae]|uniref:CesT family type III secretion system chaperone n=1 Tax=Erwinia pyrifoliae TaxID=79967 RepID=UPI00223ADD37|nr:CesT family type III secretion system chaperone [Erwinia pyrifoliae]MCT2386717.1 CesT family type III secretion system chaperone [Erwinia pyrifoliae]
MRNKEFHSLCRSITKVYQPATSPPAHQDDDVYRLTFDHDLSMHLIGTQPGYINIVATFPAPEVWFAPDGMESLLAENSFSLTHPAVIFGMDSKRRKLVISTRQPLNELKEESAVKLFQKIFHLAHGMYRGDATQPK